VIKWEEFLSSFEPLIVLSASRVWVGDTDGYEVGDIIQKDEKTTIVERVKSLLGLYTIPAYRITKKRTGCLYIVPSNCKPKKVAQWDVIPKHTGNTVTFKRPNEYKHA